MTGRVTHVVWEYGRPSETFVVDTIENLDDLGWTGSVVTGSLDDRRWFSFPPAERLHVARRPGFLTRAVGRLRPLAPVERGAAWYTSPIVGTRPDIVHAHFGWAAPYAAPAAQRLGVPLAVTFHATDVTVWPNQDPLNQRAYDRVFPHIALAMAVSRFTEGKLREAGYTGPVAIEPAGVALDELPLRGARATSDATRLLFIGRLVPRKALDLLLRALAALDVDEDVRLVVVGDGPLRADSEALVRELGIREQVDFLGALPKADVAAALREADILVLPSRTTADGEAEGSPTVLKEALAVGLAVVATDTGGTVEVLPPELRHEIVPEDDPEALARQLALVLGDRDRWAERAALGRRWVESEFDAARLAERLARRYEDARAGRAPD